MSMYTDGELLKEIILSKAQNNLTTNAKKILKDLADNLIKNYSSVNYPNLPSTAYNDALNYMYYKFNKFDVSKGSPLTYFSIVFKNSLLLSAAAYKNDKKRNNLRKQKLKELFK